MSIIFKYTLFNLQGHIHLLQGHKVCTRTRYFNAWHLQSIYQRLHFCSLNSNYLMQTKLEIEIRLTHSNVT